MKTKEFLYSMTAIFSDALFPHAKPAGLLPCASESTLNVPKTIKNEINITSSVKNAQIHI